MTFDLDLFRRQFGRGWNRLGENERPELARHVIGFVEEFLESDNEFVRGLHPAPDCQGYHPIGVCADNELLCERCIMDPTNPVLYRPDGLDDNRNRDDDQWTIVGWINSGDLVGTPDEQCAHCGRFWFDQEDQ